MSILWTDVAVGAPAIFGDGGTRGIGLADRAAADAAAGERDDMRVK